MMESNNGAMLTMPVEPAGCNNYGNGGGFGGDWGAWIILFLIFGMFGWGGFGGWGGGFGGGNGAALQGALTRADLCQDMNFQSLENATRGIQQGICDSTYALNNSIQNGFANTNMAMMQGFNSANVTALQGFNGVERGFCNLSSQLADCCCQTQRAIDGVNYNMAKNTCDLQNTMNVNTRDIIDSQNAGTRAILDYLCQEKISDLQAENQSLKLAASQADQNAFIAATQSAQTAELIRRLGADCPQPSYIVQPPTPVNFPTNCCGQFTGFNNNCGQCGNCGC